MDAFVSTRAGRREWIGLAVIALPCMLYSMDLTVLHLAVPALSKDLAPSATQLLWIIDIYGFLVAGSLITMGTVGDRIGRRRLLLIGATAFGLASLVAAFATSAEMLIAARALLGLAGATLAPSTLSLIRNMFRDTKQFTTAIGVWISSYSVGAAIGPLVGGLLLEYFWWGSVFLIAAPVMALILVLGPVLLPEYRDPDAGGVDLFSAGLSLAAVLAVIYGLKQVAQDGLSWVSGLSILGGLAVGVLFVRRQQKLADPLIDLRLFSDRSFSASLGAYTLAIVVAFGGFLFIPQYLQLVLGLSPLQAGLSTLPWSLAFVVGSMVTPMIARRVRPAFLMAAGLALAAVGNLILTQVDSVFGLGALLSGSLLAGLGLAPTFTLATDLIVGTAPPERAGVASGLSETGAELGGALGIAVLGTIGTAIYRGRLAEAVPGGVSPEAAAAARDTLGGALAAAAEIPGPVGEALTTGAREAFTQGFQVTAMIAALLSLGLAVAVSILLRHVGTHSPDYRLNGEETDELEPRYAA
jgi:DHA2 family multidrug resistance protein-like MFS transporter